VEPAGSENPQSATNVMSSVLASEPDSSADDNPSVVHPRDQSDVQVSQESKHFCLSTDKHLSSAASADADTSQKSDSQMSVAPKQRPGHRTRSSAETIACVQLERVHRRSLTSADHSRRPSSTTTRSADTGHGISSLSSSRHGRSGSSADRESRNDRSSDSEDVARGNRHDTRLTESLHRLSVTAVNSCKMKVKGSEAANTEYQAVLTRHVNQLFIRGDNVALVAIVH